jgi:hypothetical protein
LIGVYFFWMWGFAWHMLHAYGEHGLDPKSGHGYGEHGLDPKSGHSFLNL